MPANIHYAVGITVSFWWCMPANTHCAAEMGSPVHYLASHWFDAKRQSLFFFFSTAEITVSCWWCMFVGIPCTAGIAVSCWWCMLADIYHTAEITVVHVC